MFFILLLFLLICFYLSAICPNLSHKKEMEPFFNTEFAHRGLFSDNKNIPENSMKAFQEAVKQHVGIELDVHLTSDGKAVVFHDDTLTRMCRRDEVIEKMSYNDLQNCYLNHTSEKIPLLSEVLSYVDGRVPLLIELKLPSASTKLCQEVAKLLASYHGSYLIQSFNTIGLFWFRRHTPHILRGQLSSNLTKTRKNEPWIACFLVRFLLLNWIGKPDFISYKFKDRSNSSLRILKSLFQTPIAVWTLRTPEEFTKGKKQFAITIFEKNF